MKNLDRSFPITVLDVVRSGSLMRNQPFSSREQEVTRAMELMTEMGIAGKLHKAIGELSGGEMQRVFLCRALISDPKLLILDEPGTYVDNRFGREIFEKLKELNQRMAVLLVSHDTDMVLEYAKSVVHLHRRLSPYPIITT
jgi:zinc transport system ATP-binding protein